MLFRAGPGFQTPTGIAKIEVRHGIRRAFLQTGLKGCARLLILLLFEKFVACSKFLGLLIKEGRGHRRISIEAEHRNKYEDFSHQPPPHSVEETLPLYSSHYLLDGETIYLTSQELNHTRTSTTQCHSAIQFRLPWHGLARHVLDTCRRSPLMFARLNRLQKYRQPNISCVRSFENCSPGELTLLSPRGLPCSRTSTFLDHF